MVLQLAQSQPICLIAGSWTAQTGTDHATWISLVCKIGLLSSQGLEAMWKSWVSLDPDFIIAQGVGQACSQVCLDTETLYSEYNPPIILNFA